MKKLTAIPLFLIFSSLLMAQSQNQKPASPPQTPPPSSNAQTQQQPTTVPVGTVMENQLNIIEREFSSAAEAMPEDKYSFSPAGLNIQGSAFQDVRTFAQQVKHVATANYQFYSAALGEKPAVDTSNENGPASITTKADIIKYLKDSFALGHRAAKTLTAQNFEERVTFGEGKATRLFLNTFAVAHAFDHYGQMVEYLRMNGIIPPASRPQQ